MELAKITQGINDKLAGEMFTYEMLKGFMDDVIDDVNARLNSTFPVFSDFNMQDHPQYPNYNFFPDRYIRQVVIVGAAYRFYITDEEGIDTARTYGYQYEAGLYLMERDHLDQIPEEYQGDTTGSVVLDDLGPSDYPVKFNDLW